MKKIVNNKSLNTMVKSIESRYGVSLGYSSDAKMYKALKEEGVPSLSKLLKRISI